MDPNAFGSILNFRSMLPMSYVTLNFVNSLRNYQVPYGTTGALPAAKYAASIDSAF